MIRLSCTGPTDHLSYPSITTAIFFSRLLSGTGFLPRLRFSRLSPQPKYERAHIYIYFGKKSLRSVMHYYKSRRLIPSEKIKENRHTISSRNVFEKFFDYQKSFENVSPLLNRPLHTFSVQIGDFMCTRCEKKFILHFP